jgi:adenine phosphoribosyltransferase
MTNKVYVSEELKSEIVENSIRPLIRIVPDFPIPGINFKDITPIVGDYAALELSTMFMSRPFQDLAVDKIAGISSRGLYFAPGIARLLHVGLVPLRKEGKLPWNTYTEDFTLEYGTGVMEMHQDAIDPGERVVVVDDVLATGGTMKAACNLVEQAGGLVVGIVVLIDLGLEVKENLPVRPHALIQY